MDAPKIPLLEQRRIEAAAFRLIYDELEERFGAQRALEIIGQAVERAAETAGADFAAQAPDGPGLEHFAKMLDRLTEAGGLKVSGAALQPQEFIYTVDRCRYVEMYREMGISPELAYTLSCRRDGAFARGYDKRIKMERSQTLAEGSPACRFSYTWS